jgi:hypothetical protein
MKPDTEVEVEFYLKKKFSDILVALTILEKEDLDMVSFLCFIYENIILLVLIWTFFSLGIYEELLLFSLRKTFIIKLQHDFLFLQTSE